jgi:uncharacterized protein (DUF1015 family)
VRDPEPAYWLYAQRFRLPDGSERERVGVMGALRLESFDTGRVRPHERTLAKAKDDRRALLEACATAFSPIFGLVAVPGWSFGALVPSRPPDVDVAGPNGARDRLWRIADGAALTTIAEHTNGREVFIADGHHRYETALRYRDERRAALGAAAPPPGSVPWDWVFTYLTTMEDPGLVVLPTHRVVQTLSMPADAFLGACDAHFERTAFPATDAGRTQLLAALEGAAPGRVRIGVVLRDGLWLLAAETGALPWASAVAPPLRALDVAALHQIVLAGILGLPIGDRGGAPGLSYTQDAAAAAAAVARGAAAAFLLPATRVDDLRAVGSAGLTMPEKSTYFHPKLLSGLLLYPLEG